MRNLSLVVNVRMQSRSMATYVDCDYFRTFIQTPEVCLMTTVTSERLALLSVLGFVHMHVHPSPFDIKIKNRCTTSCALLVYMFSGIHTGCQEPWAESPRSRDDLPTDE